MEEQFVPYELALKLKELGFDEECLGEYRQDREYETYDPRKGEDVTLGSNKIFFTTSYYGWGERSLHLAKTPLWQQAFDWFREKFNLFGYIGIVNWHHLDEHKYTPHIKGIEPLKLNIMYRSYDKYEDAQKMLLESLIKIANEQNTKTS